MSRPYSYFPTIQKPIQFEGPKSKNPFAFKFYDRKRLIRGRPMEQVLKPAFCWWHGLTGEGEDPFGGPAHQLSWPAKSGTVQEAMEKVDAGCELSEITGIKHFAFHCLDLVGNGSTWTETRSKLESVGEYLAKKMRATGLKCLWATQNTFSEACFSNGGGTAVDAKVWAYAATRVRVALDLGKLLNAENHVFWDGRGGYSHLLSQDLHADLSHKGDLLCAAVEYRNRIGHSTQFLVEPKPKEPTILQFDSDAGSIMNFLLWYDRENGTKLFDEFKLNLEEGHATLAGKEFHFEIAYAAMMGKLGGLDANQNHQMVGWDSDHMPFDARKAALAMYYVLKAGGLGAGGINFDAKVRRSSVEPADRIHGHILALDTYAHGLMAADILLNDSDFNALVAERYTGWDTAFGQKVRNRTITLEECEAFVTANGDNPPLVRSGREELVESMINSALARAVLAL